MNFENTEGVPNWYLIRTHPRQDDRAAENLRAWSVEVFAPRMLERRFNPFTDEPMLVVKPLFGGYLFARFILDDLFHKVRFTRGVHSMVSFGGYPIPVEEAIVDIIKSRTDKDGLVRIGEEINPGDRVIIKNGPLKGFTGIFERYLKESERVMILLNTVNYQAHVQVDKDLVKKCSEPVYGD